MTNEHIILNKRIELMKNGKIEKTGRTFEFTDASGRVHALEEPEELHTYAAWKTIGYQVQKGQKAVARFRIWKHITKKDEETEKQEAKMLFIESSFFAQHQVAAIK